MDQPADTEASSPYQSIAGRLGLKAPLPYTPKWSAAADFLSLLIDYALDEKPAVIVECSSGLSTLVLARCCEINRKGHVYSLENGEEFVAKTVNGLEDFQLTNFATVMHAPLVRTVLEQTDYQWYQYATLEQQVAEIDMLVIDGPPGFIQPQSRYPAVPLLHNRLAERAVVFLDDAGREDEKKLVARWLQQFPSLHHRYYETQRGCSVLSSRSIVASIPDL